MAFEQDSQIYHLKIALLRLSIGGEYREVEILEVCKKHALNYS